MLGSLLGSTGGGGGGGGGVSFVDAATSAVTLESASPAASNSGNYAIVTNTTPQDADGIYLSNGTSWIKKLDDSDFSVGTRTDLFDFSYATPTYEVTNLAPDSGTTLSSNSAFQVATPLADVIDEDLTTHTQSNTGSPGNVSFEFEFDTPRKIGKVIYTTRLSTHVSEIRTAYLQYDISGSGTWVDITGYSSLDNSATVDGAGLITFPDTAAQTTFTIETTNQTLAYKFRLLTVTGQHASYVDVAELKIYESADFGAGVNAVGSINILQNKVEGFENWFEDPTSAGDALYPYPANAIVAFEGKLYKNISGSEIAAGENEPDVDTTNWKLFTNEVERTATAVSASTGNEGIVGVTNNDAERTITLSTSDVVEGKVITIKDEEGTAGDGNPITIATEASETIDGRSTIKITKNYGWLKLYCNGTNWFIISSDRFGTTSAVGTATLELDDEVLFCTANTFTVNLPTAAGILGKKYYVDNSGAGTVTIDPASSETIDGSSTLAVAAGDSVTIVSDGTNWRLLN